jgi:hypothetical protein
MPGKTSLLLMGCLFLPACTMLSSSKFDVAVSAQVVDEAGAPVEGAAVVVRPESRKVFAGLPEILSDSSGRIEQTETMRWCQKHTPLDRLTGREVSSGVTVAVAREGFTEYETLVDLWEQGPPARVSLGTVVLRRETE